MEKGRNNAILLTIIGIATLLVAIVGATFAYFSAIVTGSETTSTIVVESANGGTSTFTGGDKVTVENIYPKGSTSNIEDAWLTKVITFTHQNTNAVNNFVYDLTLNYDNTFAANELAYTFAPVTNYCSDFSTATQSKCQATWASTSTSPSINPASASGNFAYGNGQTAPLGRVTINTTDLSAGVTHAFVLRIFYPNKENVNQNYTNETINQKPASLTAYVSFTEVTNS